MLSEGEMVSETSPRNLVKSREEKNPLRVMVNKNLRPQVAGLRIGTEPKEKRGIRNGKDRRLKEKEKGEEESERTALLFASGASVERPMWTSAAVKGGKSTTPEDSGGFLVPEKMILWTRSGSMALIVREANSSWSILLILLLYLRDICGGCC
jgi:hypothetical protein